VRFLLAAAVLAALAVTAAGCGEAGTGGLSAGGDTARGEDLFKKQCGRCHTLAAAETAGVAGPNLDAAFSAVRAQGFEESSIQQLVAGQIKFPVTEPSTGAPGMPANLVTGDDVDAVAAYVASVAGKPGAAPPPPGDGQAAGGKDVFKTNCAGCHTLADAGTTGTVGPNLDRSKPAKALVVDRVTNGKGAMPPFKTTLTGAQIQAVADYVSSAAGG